MRNKKLLVALLALILALALTACGQNADAPQITGSITVVWDDGTATTWSDVAVAEGSSASDALRQVLQAQKMAYNYKDGMWSGINGVESGMEAGWLFFVGGEMLMVGADDVILADGYSFSFEYVPYAEYFSW